MASKDYLKLCEEAQKKKLKLIKKQEKQIKEIYNDMYLKVSKKLSKVNPNTLSERYLQELKKVLEKEIKASNKQVKEVIKDNIEKSSKLANDTQLDFFMSINDKYRLNMGDTFSSMFSKIPKEAMNEILFGKVYKDRAGLSERIWLDTKKFNKDIDYVIAEGIANKKPTYEIAKDLEKYVNPNAKKEWEWSKVYPNANKVVDYNAQRLARTSIQHAFQQAQKRSCKKNPYIEYIKWLSSNTSRTCELCNSRDGQLYKVNDLPLDHPNGLCTTIPQIEKSLDEIGEELRSWIDGEANPMLDKWFKKHGEEFIPKSDKEDVKKAFKDNNEKSKSKKENKKALNKDGQEIVFNFAKMKEDRRKIVIDTITELSNKYNTRLREVNDEANGKGVKGSVDLSFVMRLSTIKKNTIVHEFAHSLAMSRADKFGLTNDVDFWKEIRKVNREYKKAIREDSNKKISEYSLESIDEFMAEAFCHSYLKNTKHLGWEYGNDYEFSDKVMDVINKYFAK